MDAVVQPPLGGFLEVPFMHERATAMSHAFHQLYYHFAWATHERAAIIDRNWRPQLLQIIGQEVKKLGAWPIRHNAMPDHAHLLVRLPPTLSVADFIGRVKGATSFQVNRDIRPGFKFRWQEGYESAHATQRRTAQGQPIHRPPGRASPLRQAVRGFGDHRNGGRALA
jgi:putative transposase